MKQHKCKWIFFLLIFFSFNLYSQHISDLRLNEILIKNEGNFIDEYGRHVPWIEIFNTAYNTVDVGGCYLTNDTTGLSDGTGMKKWYRIPKGDPKTSIPQRSFVVFYMDNAPLYGTFHVNFDPSEDGASNYVALINLNGRTLIDIIEFPDSLRNSSTHSYGCYEDGINKADEEDVKPAMGWLDYFTPGSTNKVFEGMTKSERLAEQDPYGIGMALISMSVVFTALIIIYLMIKLFAKGARKKVVKTVENKELASEETTEKRVKNDGDILTSEEVAAIGMALHLYYNNLHDTESEIITIETPSAHYSPWAQKHLVIKQVQRKK